jgi:nitric oxide reductase NorD protein
MEEWVGLQWHRFVTRRAEAGRGDASPTEARLADVLPAVTALMHAAGARQRVAAAAPVRVGGTRSFWQRVAGTGTRLPLAQIDADVLALPARVAVFGTAALNRDLYLWWAALAGAINPAAGWAATNTHATAATLRRFPGLHARWQRLRAAELALRGDGGAQSAAEQQVRAALAHRLDAATESGGAGRLEPAAPMTGAVDAVDAVDAADAAGLPGAAQPADVAPVWCWLLPCAAQGARLDPADGVGAQADGAPADALPGRRRAAALPQHHARAPLLLASKAEALRTFADPMAIDRADDDTDDGSDRVAADELETLSMQRSTGARRAARVRFDLDLPSAAADDLPAGDGEWLPEWNPKSHRVEPRRVRTQPLQARDAMPWRAPPALHAHAARVRQRLQQQRAAPRWQHGCADGEAIDIDAWVLAQAEPGHRGDTGGPSEPQGQTGAAADRLYQRRVRDRHDLASLLLADLSLSTDAHVDDDQRVIDVVRDSLYVFGEALAGSGDAFSMVGFSSLRRSLRLHELKGFDERWAAPALARIGAVKPGYYTRMGAALRAGTRRLALRPERQRLLLLLTDGKPHDLDGYEGRWGLEDTRQAVVEARRAGVLPFALSIDAQAGDVMPRLFGPGGWAWVRRPAELPQRLTALYARLTR